MKKVLLSITLVAGLMTSNNLKAQFEQGNSSVQVGYGFGNFISAVFKTYETAYPATFSFKSVGPAFLKYEYAVSDKIGFGLNIAYASATVSYTDDSWFVSGTPSTTSIKWSTISALARMNLHFGNSERFDPFWGVGMGYRTASWKFENDSPNYINTESTGSFMPFGFETTVGARFYLTENIGLYIETGLAKAIIQGGLTAKF